MQESELHRRSDDACECIQENEDGGSMFRVVWMEPVRTLVLYIGNDGPCQGEGGCCNGDEDDDGRLLRIVREEIPLRTHLRQRFQNHLAQFQGARESCEPKMRFE